MRWKKPRASERPLKWLLDVAVATAPSRFPLRSDDALRRLVRQSSLGVERTVRLGTYLLPGSSSHRSYVPPTAIRASPGPKRLNPLLLPRGGGFFH